MIFFHAMIVKRQTRYIYMYILYINRVAQSKADRVAGGPGVSAHSYLVLCGVGEGSCAMFYMAACGRLR